MFYSTAKTHAPRTEPVPQSRIRLAAPSHEEIARLAYSYWEARGRGHGSDHEDWLRAERELRRRRGY